jgi:hypothetical protein
MTDKPAEGQQELFTEFQGEKKQPARLSSWTGSRKPVLVSTSVEQLILALIIAILAACLVFFLGVLRGRSLSPPPKPAPAAGSPALRPVSPAPATRPAGVPPAILVQDADRPYTIQLVTHKRKDLAEREASMLRSSGFFSVIIPSGEYYQVCAGQYLNKEDAKKDLRFFSAKYKDCFLRRR